MKIWNLQYADSKFSKFIIKRDGRCARCGCPIQEILTCSHFKNRQHKGTRFDPDNCDAVCWPCHSQKWENDKAGTYREFKLRQLGVKRLEALEKRAIAPYQETQAIRDCMAICG